MSLHEALSGVRPWQGCRTVGELILAIHSADPPPLRSLAPWVPAPLAAVVERGLRRDPGERWPTAEALRQALLPLAAPSPLPAGALRPADTSALAPSAGSTWESHTTHTSAPRPRAPLLAGGAALGAALLLLALRPARPAAAPGAGPLVEPAPSSALPAPSASAARVEGQVRLSPPDAEALVRGEPAAAPEGLLTLRGLPGERVAVRLRQGDRSATFHVVLGLDGIPEPEQLTLPPPAPSALAPRASAAPGPAPAQPPQQPTGRQPPAPSAAPPVAPLAGTASIPAPRLRGFDE